MRRRSTVDGSTVDGRRSTVGGQESAVGLEE